MSKAATLTRLTTQIWHLGIYFVIWISPPLFVWFYSRHLCCISHDSVVQQNGTVWASLERNKGVKSMSLRATGARWVDRYLSFALLWCRLKSFPDLPLLITRRRDRSSICPFSFSWHALCFTHSGTKLISVSQGIFIQAAGGWGD